MRKTDLISYSKYLEKVLDLSHEKSKRINKVCPK